MRRAVDSRVRCTSAPSANVFVIYCTNGESSGAGWGCSQADISVLPATASSTRLYAHRAAAFSHSAYCRWLAVSCAGSQTGMNEHMLLMPVSVLVAEPGGAGSRRQ